MFLERHRRQLTHFSMLGSHSITVTKSSPTRMLLDPPPRINFVKSEAQNPPTIYTRRQPTIAMSYTRDAARAVLSAYGQSASDFRKQARGLLNDKVNPFFYADLNATAPTSCVTSATIVSCFSRYLAISSIAN